MSAASLKAIEDAVIAHNAELNVGQDHAPDWDHVTSWVILFECKRFGESDDGTVLMHTNQYAVSAGQTPNGSVGLLTWGLDAVIEDSSGGSSYIPD